MSEDAKRYEVGFQYTDYVRNLPSKASVGRTTFEFESLSADGSTYRVGGRHLHFSAKLTIYTSTNLPVDVMGYQLKYFIKY